MKSKKTKFESTLNALQWKQIDFCRRTGIERSAPRRWLNGTTPVPGWVPSYLDAMLAIQRLHNQFIKTDAPGDEID